MNRLFLILFTLLGVLTLNAQQFRLVGVASNFQSVNDSTYTAEMTFLADQTGKSFIPTNIADDGSMRVFFNEDFSYTVTDAADKTFSSATLTLEEFGDTDGSPSVSTEGVVYAHLDLNFVPTTPSNSTGMSPKLFSEIQTINKSSGNVDNTLVTNLQTSLNSVIDSNKVVISDHVNVAIDTTAFDAFTGILNVTLTDTTTQDYAITLPNPIYSSAKKSFTINSKASGIDTYYYIETVDTLYSRLRVDGHPAKRYYLEDETVTISWVNNKWEINHNNADNHIADGIEYFSSRLFDIGDKVTLGKSGKEYVIRSTTYETPDSVSVIKVRQKILYPQNQLANSDKSIKTVLDNGWSWADGLVEPLGNADDIRGPTGEKDAIRFVILANSSNNISYTQNFTYDNHAIGDSSTLSFYYRKAKPGSVVNTNIRIADRTGANWLQDEILASDFTAEWKKYTLNFNDREGPDPDNQIKIFFDDALAGDTIYLSRPMVHLGWERSRYINSGDDANFYGADNFVYAVATNIEEKSVSRNYPANVDDRISVFIKDRSFYLEELNIDPNEDVVPYMNEAVDYCQTYNACDRIVLPRNCSHLTQFVAPDGFTISGGDYGQNSISISPTDSTLILNTTDPDGDYSRGITFENLGYNVTTRTNVVIETNRSLDFHFENVAIDGNDLTDLGTRVGSQSISGALSTTAFRLDIRECGVGLEIKNAGNNHTFDHCALNNNNINLLIDGGSNIKILQGTNLESSDSLALLVLEANRITFDGAYFEEGVSRINNCKNLNILNTYISGTLDSVFLSQVGYLNIQNCGIAGGFNITENNLKGMSLIGNFFQTKNDLNGIHATLFPRRGFISTGNFYGDDLDRQEIDYFGQPEYAVTDATYLQGVVTLNDVSFRSIIQNLVQNSDSIMIEDGSYDYYDITNDVEASPVYPDSTTMDRITITQNWDGDGDPGQLELYLPVHQEIEDVLDIGDEATVSHWIKAESDSSNFLLLRYRLDPGHLLSFKFPADGKYRRVVLTVDSLDQEVTGLQLGIFQAKVGDVLTMGHLQLTEGRQPGIETYTYETGIDSVGPAAPKGNFYFEGDVEFAGAVTGAEDFDQLIRVQNESDFGVIDSDKVYFIDGQITLTDSIEIPAGGIFLRGHGMDISKLIMTDSNSTMFVSAAGGSGNIFIEDMSLEVTGTGSKVYDLTATGSPAIELNNVNYNNCSSLGEITSYRQGLERNTGRFGGTPNLILSGTWAGGFLITTSIVRGLTDGSYALFEEGISFTMASRFKCDMNVDLNSTISLLDFDAANFPNPNTLQLTDMIVTRNGATDASDATLIPNIDETELPSIWTNNIGIPNTYVGIEGKITTEAATTIVTSGTFVDVAGTFTTTKEVHYTLENSNEFTAQASSPREMKVNVNFVIQGGANDEIELKIVIWDDSASTFVDYKSSKRTISNIIGGNDVAYFNFSDRIVVDDNDYVKLVVTNNTDTTNVTAQEDSEITVETP